MVLMLSQLELCSIDRMTPPELIDAVRTPTHALPLDLLGQLDEQSHSSLQLVLLAGRLIRVLRHQRTDG